MNSVRLFLKKIIFVALAASVLTGCTSVRTPTPSDPWESFNRSVYSFNDTVDKAVVKPVAQGYKAVIPDTGRTMVGNFFSNLNDVVIAANNLLQFKLVRAFSDTGRILINSTVGVFGLVDVASQVGYEKHNEDFGQTLGYWGVQSGPYLVMPIFGSSTLRDSLAGLGDSQINPLWRINNIPTRNGLNVTKQINRRAVLLDEENVINEAAIDRYSFTRDYYLQFRKNQIYDGNPPREKFDDDENLLESSQEIPTSDQESTQDENKLAAEGTSLTISVVQEVKTCEGTSQAISIENYSTESQNVPQLTTVTSVNKVWASNRMLMSSVH
jgi:phospholipid-binding lipoprotein MlaA